MVKVSDRIKKHQLITFFIISSVFVLCIWILEIVFTPEPIPETAFEVSAGRSDGPATGPYNVLVVREDGLAYYEDGYKQHFQPTTVSHMKQVLISIEQLNMLKHLIEQCPSDVSSKLIVETQNGLGQSGTSVYYPSVSSTEKTISANYNAFDQNLTILSDVPDLAKELWVQLNYLVEKQMTPTKKRPDLGSNLPRG